MARTCVVCGKQYSYCPNCSKDAKKPSWMTIFCSDACHDVYEIVTDWTEKRISDVDAKIKLEKINLDDVELNPETQEQVDTIMGNKIKSVEADENKEIKVEITNVSEEKSFKNFSKKKNK